MLLSLIAASMYLIFSARSTALAQQSNSTTMVSIVRVATLIDKAHTSSNPGPKDISATDLAMLTTAMPAQRRNWRDWFGYSLMWLSDPPAHVRTEMLGIAGLPLTMSVWKQVEHPEQALGLNGEPQPDKLVDYTLLHKFAQVKVFTRKHGGAILYSTTFNWEQITTMKEFSIAHDEAEIVRWIKACRNTRRPIETTTESYIGYARPGCDAGMLLPTTGSMDKVKPLPAPITFSQIAMETRQLAVTH